MVALAGKIHVRPVGCQPTVVAPAHGSALVMLDKARALFPADALARQAANSASYRVAIGEREARWEASEDAVVPCVTTTKCDLGPLSPSPDSCSSWTRGSSSSLPLSCDGGDAYYIRGIQP